MFFAAKLSLSWFLLSCSLTILGFNLIKINIPDSSFYYNVSIGMIPVYALLNWCIIFISTNFKRQVGICSSFLGLIFSVGILISMLLSHRWAILGWYICFVSFFHFSEFLIIAIANPLSLSIDSFMLNHSYAYGIALLACLIEYFTEAYFFPDLKNIRIISLIGFILCVFGEIIRKVAIITARTNFHHIVQTAKKPNHQLVTHGIYGLWRHPGYVGWFYWAIGTQLILVNPICLLGYTIKSWIFFHDRIISEEIALIKFFGAEYIKYKQTTPSGLPFIGGYNIEVN